MCYTTVDTLTKVMLSSLSYYKLRLSPLVNHPGASQYYNTNVENTVVVMMIMHAT